MFQELTFICYSGIYYGFYLQSAYNVLIICAVTGQILVPGVHFACFHAASVQIVSTAIVCKSVYTIWIRIFIGISKIHFYNSFYNIVA